MDLSSGGMGEIIFYGLFIFFGLVITISGVVMSIFWRRRKLTWTNFLNKTGRWEKIGWMPKKISSEFVYDGEPYKFNIEKCTRDSLNRPIAHYYKGNPEQQIFNIDLTNKVLEIGTEEITQNDFMVLMRSKVLKDIFTDDEIMNLLMIILIVTILGSLAIILILFVHHPAVKLSGDNETISIIARGVKLAILTTNGGA